MMPLLSLDELSMNVEELIGHVHVTYYFHKLLIFFDNFSICFSLKFDFSSEQRNTVPKHIIKMMKFKCWVFLNAK